MGTDANDMDAAARAVGLEIPADCRPGVLRYLALAATMADLVMTFPLDPADESGNVFTPVEPGGRS